MYKLSEIISKTKEQLLAVATEEGVLVNHQHVDAMLKHRVRGGETAEATTNDNYLLHCSYKQLPPILVCLTVPQIQYAYVLGFITRLRM